jgi:uncharacterized membrane protein YbaN (DUF454 family)
MTAPTSASPFSSAARGCPVPHGAVASAGASAGAAPVAPVPARGVRRIAWAVAGALSLLLGLAGLVLPVIPGGCMLLVGAWCWGKADPRLVAWLERTPLIGRHLQTYRCGTGLAPSAKWTSAALLWGALGWALVKAPDAVHAAGFVALGLAVSWHLWRLPVPAR